GGVVVIVKSNGEPVVGRLIECGDILRPQLPRDGCIHEQQIVISKRGLRSSLLNWPVLKNQLERCARTCASNNCQRGKQRGRPPNHECRQTRYGASHFICFAAPADSPAKIQE